MARGANPSILRFNRTNHRMTSLIDKDIFNIELPSTCVIFTLGFFGSLMVILKIVYCRYLRVRFSPDPSITICARYSNNHNQNQLQDMIIISNRSNRPKKLSRMDFFLLNMSIADMYMSTGSILTILLWTLNDNLFYGGDLACRAVAYFQLVSVYYSTYVLCAMAIDQYVAVCRPLYGFG